MASAFLAKSAVSRGEKTRRRTEIIARETSPLKNRAGTGDGTRLRLSTLWTTKHLLLRTRTLQTAAPGLSLPARQASTGHRHQATADCFIEQLRTFARWNELPDPASHRPRDWGPRGQAGKGHTRSSGTPHRAPNGKLPYHSRVFYESSVPRRIELSGRISAKLPRCFPMVDRNPASLRGVFRFHRRWWLPDS